MSDRTIELEAEIERLKSELEAEQAKSAALAAENLSLRRQLESEKMRADAYRKISTVFMS